MTSCELFDWTKCIFCQKTQKGLKTTCPALSKRSDVGRGYKTLGDKIAKCVDCGQLPAQVNLKALDEGDGVEATCSRKKAFWHRKCMGLALHTTTVNNNILRHSAESSEPVSDSHSDSEPPCKKRLTRGTNGSVCVNLTSLCFFCEKTGSDLRQVMTSKVDIRVRECAALLQDSLLLGKLSRGDMIAIEAKYHPGCLLALYEKAQRLQKNHGFEEHDRFDIQAESLALAEVVAHIEEIKMYEVTPSVFKLNEIIQLYSAKLERYNVAHTSKVHPTRFKERLLESCPYLLAANHGRDVLLTFNEHVGFAFRKLRETADLEAVHMMHTAKLLRSAMFAANTCNFNGCFETDSQLKSVPHVLLTFVNMLLEGPNCIQSSVSQSALSISQLIVYNSIRRPRSPASSDTGCSHVAARHSLGQEKPLPIYLGLMLHSATRKKKTC